MEHVNVKVVSPFQRDAALSDLPVLSSSCFPLTVFDPRSIEFTEALSKAILQNKNFNRIPALVALGFWLRKSNIIRMQNENTHLFSNAQVKSMPLGKVLHVCPSNVDTIFVYSLVISLLAGNKNVLRVSSKAQPAFLDFLFETINALCATDAFRIFADYINIISYPHNDEISSFLSEKADGRIVWGGDATASVFRSINGNPRSRDIYFSDRLSFSVIDCSEFLAASEEAWNELTRKFYNDSYTFDQKGCSSPQQIFFKGTTDECSRAATLFFNLLDSHARKLYEYDEASLSNLKFNSMVDDVLSDTVKNILHHTAYTCSIETRGNAVQHSCGGGYFYTHFIGSVKEIEHFVNTKIQTVSYYGLSVEELNRLAELGKGRGIDRIVPVGKALDFDYVWDGYNLFEILTKKLHFL